MIVMEREFPKVRKTYIGHFGWRPIALRRGDIASVIKRRGTLALRR
jgi:hypothetical protein